MIGNVLVQSTETPRLGSPSLAGDTSCLLRLQVHFSCQGAVKPRGIRQWKSLRKFTLFLEWFTARDKTTQIFQTTTQTAGDTLCISAKGPCACLMYSKQDREGFHSCCHQSTCVESGQVCAQDISTCCTFPAGRVNATLDTLTCTPTSLQGFIACLRATRAPFSFNYPPKGPISSLPWSPEEDEGWAGAWGSRTVFRVGDSHLGCYGIRLKNGLH